MYAIRSYYDYLNTKEGQKLPVEHCIAGTDGWAPNAAVWMALMHKNVADEQHMIAKDTFRITSYNVCYTKLLRSRLACQARRQPPRQAAVQAGSPAGRGRLKTCIVSENFGCNAYLFT